MTILVISVDLECCRCRAKITKVLDCLTEEFCIEKVEFEDKLNKVIVRGKFCGDKLSKKICCKACRIVKDISVVDVWPPPKPKPQELKPKPEEHEPKPEEPKLMPEEPKPPKPEVKLVPYPYPLPYPLPLSQSWPCFPCPPQPLPLPWPPHCSCSKDDDGCSCGGGSKPPICCPPSGPGACPPWWCDMVSEDNPGCSIM
ncbi:unnamed protein product [Urochloa decumbens]|uniref:Uncharacterized protein n=1 Tax=Urochloa decumbens TaxID=240449 RepID=A0ABC9CXU0_9POAL